MCSLIHTLLNRLSVLSRRLKAAFCTPYGIPVVCWSTRDRVTGRRTRRHRSPRPRTSPLPAEAVSWITVILVDHLNALPVPVAEPGHVEDDERPLDVSHQTISQLTPTITRGGMTPHEQVEREVAHPVTLARTTQTASTRAARTTTECSDT